MGFFSGLLSMITGAIATFNPVAFLINTALTWVISEVLSDEVNADQAADERHGGVLLNKASSNASVPIIYGQRRVGGTIVFKASSGTDNEYLYMVVIVAEGQVSAITDVYINDIPASDAKFNGLTLFNTHLGSDGQAADTTLVAANVDWTAAHKLSGLAYVMCRFKWNQDVFGSAPRVTFLVSGKTVYNPDTGATAYSTNPALCWRDYMTNTRYGKGLPASAIDDASVIAAATACNQLVTPYAGGSDIKLFECNAVINTSRSLMTNTRILLSGMRALMPFSEGQYGLVIEGQKVGNSVFHFTEDHLLGSVSLESSRKSEKYNRVIATFSNPEKNWNADNIEWPKTGSSDHSDYLAEDNSTELVGRIDLATVTNPYTAEDVAELVVKRSRAALKVGIVVSSEGMTCAVGDVISISHGGFGWVAKDFRVMGVTLNPDCTVQLECIQHEDNIYPWGSKTEEPTSPNTNLPDPFNVLPPTPTDVLEELYTTVNSKGTQTRATLIWSAPSDAFVSKYEAGYKLSSATNYTFITTTSALEARIDDIPAELYDFRVRSINSMGIQSSWAYLNNKTISGLTAVPSDINNFSIRALGDQAHISWSRVTDLDVINGGYIRIRHTPLVNNASWEDGQDIGEAIAGAQTYTVLPLLAGTYMAKAVDEGGRFSTNAKFAVTTVPNILDFNAVATVSEHSTYAGTKTDMSVVNGVLVLDGSPVVESSGTYVFANSIDLGETYTSRLTANLKSSVSVATDLVDNRTNNIDTWQNFDGESSDAISAELQLRTTSDNPASSPTWMDWSPFLVGDYHARGYEFRVVVTNSDSTFQISITELTVTVDMPDRFEKANDLSLSSSGTAVSFGSGFKAVPVVGITMNDSNSGDYYRLTSKLRTGFTVQCFNSSDVGIVRSINWQAVGYGKEAA